MKKSDLVNLGAKKLKKLPLDNNFALSNQDRYRIAHFLLEVFDEAGILPYPDGDWRVVDREGWYLSEILEESCKWEGEE